MTETIIGRSYNIVEIIGQGAFGMVAKGVHIRTREDVAIKISRLDSTPNMLKNESTVYLLLNKRDASEGFPAVKWVGKDEKYYYMVTELLGGSLTAFKYSEDCRTLNNVLDIGEQLITRLKTIHGHHLVHRDIKPDNILFGLGKKSRVVYLIDFGFCKSYSLADGSHIKLKHGQSIIGTPYFVSINVHDELSYSRRDDIESVIYVLLYLFLPLGKWNQLFRACKTNDELRQLKNSLPENGIVPPFIKNALIYCRQLEYEAAPDYSRLIQILRASEII